MALTRKQPTSRQPINRTSTALDSGCLTALLLCKQAIMRPLSCRVWPILILLLTHGPVVSTAAAAAANDIAKSCFHSHHPRQQAITQGSYVCITEWNNKHCLVLRRTDRINRAIKWLCKVQTMGIQKTMAYQHFLVQLLLPFRHTNIHMVLARHVLFGRPSPSEIWP